LASDVNFPFYTRIQDGVINIAYVGNLGTLYDFNTLISSLSFFKDRTMLHIIGDGDNKDLILKSLDSCAIKYKYYGIIYDENSISDILKKCDLGFNGYLNTVASLSYKSVTYFSHSLPIINSMNGDLFEIVNKFNVGFNYKSGDITSLKNCFDQIFNSDLSKLKFNSYYFFKNNFQSHDIILSLQKIIDKKLLTKGAYREKNI
jgi:glycosyltransferase involved in cell wall biosynthesis